MTRRGFSMIEMVCAMVIIAIIVLALHSTTLLASRLTPTKIGVDSPRVAGARAVDWLKSDLAYATAINVNTANTIEFTVPDRTGDAVNETIRYQWSGVAGAPLQRTINGSAVTLVSDVREFALEYSRITTPRPTTYTESSETVLAGYDTSLALFGYAITYSDWLGQYFRPSLPNGAVYWKVTRAAFKADRYWGTTGRTRVQIRKAKGTLPGAVLDEVTILESALPTSIAWQIISFPSVPMQPAGTGMCLVLQWANDDQACEVAYQLQTLADSDQKPCYTWNGGANWSNSTSNSMSFYIWGKYYTANAAANDYSLSNVRYTLRAGTDPSNRLQGTVRVLNRPTVTGP